MFSSLFDQYLYYNLTFAISSSLALIVFRSEQDYSCSKSAFSFSA